MTPSLPSPPTDNLYKFMALAGLVLMFGAPIYWAKYEADLTDYVVEQIRNLPEVPPLYSTPTPEDRAEAKRKAEAWKPPSGLARYMRHDIAINTISLVLFIAGFICTGLGFWLWYVRVQRHLDALLLKQATKPPERHVAFE
jgi:hypothetical protein